MTDKKNQKDKTKNSALTVSEKMKTCSIHFAISTTDSGTVPLSFAAV